MAAEATIWPQCPPMRLTPFYENAKLALLWAVLGFAVFDEEPTFDFSDWNAVQVVLLALGLFAITWENKLRAQFGGAWVSKDLTLVNAIFFYVYSLERYCLVIFVIFFSHCLTPLEAELMDSAEVFGANFQACATFLFHGSAFAALVSLYGLLGAAATAVHRPRIGQLAAALVLALMANAWVSVGWDLATNSLSLFSLSQAEALNMAHTPSTLTYNSISNTADQFDWHKEQTRPFPMRFETFYLFMIQLNFFIALSLSVWVWGLLVIEVFTVGARRRSSIFWGVALRSLFHNLTAAVVFGLWAAAPMFRALLHTPLEFWAHV